MSAHLSVTLGITFAVQSLTNGKRVVYLEASYDLSERQRTLTAADESGGGKPEHLVQVGFFQSIKTCKTTLTTKHVRARTPGSGGGGRLVKRVEEKR